MISAQPLRKFKQPSSLKQTLRRWVDTHSCTIQCCLGLPIHSNPSGLAQDCTGQAQTEIDGATLHVYPPPQGSRQFSFLSTENNMSNQWRIRRGGAPLHRPPDRSDNFCHLADTRDRFRSTCTADQTIQQIGFRQKYPRGEIPQRRIHQSQYSTLGKHLANTWQMVDD